MVPATTGSTIDATAIAALQATLGAEHAALWSYSFAGAFLTAAELATARTDADAHRDLRSEIEQTLSDVGARAVTAQPAYALPKPVTDAASAAALLVVAETDALAAWRSLMERTSDQGLRKAALDALTAGTVRCARWRGVVNTPPAIPQFPGQQA
jgi:hypothetical protein